MNLRGGVGFSSVLDPPKMKPNFHVELLIRLVGFLFGKRFFTSLRFTAPEGKFDAFFSVR